jgi:Leucine-rich repeat (LRR) protein
MFNLAHSKLSGHIENISEFSCKEHVDVNVIRFSAWVVLTLMQEINLQFNFITSIGANVFCKFSALTTLFLGGNEISEIPDLQTVPNLTCLKLNNNKLTYVGSLGKFGMQCWLLIHRFPNEAFGIGSSRKQDN